MASTSETGHAKIVANFEKLVSNVTSLGDSYKPSKAGLTVQALSIQLTTAKAAIDAVHSAESADKIASTARDAAFSQLSKLATRINNAVKASDSPQQVDKNVQSLVRKLQGHRATPKKTDEQKKAAAAAGSEVIEISSSQMGFDLRLDNFDKLIKLLSSITAYAPNEEELKISALTALYNDLTMKNTAVVSAETTLKNARIARNNVLYHSLTGVVDVSVDVKSYVKSVFGSTSPQFKALSGLRFISHN